MLLHLPPQLHSKVARAAAHLLHSIQGRLQTTGQALDNNELGGTESNIFEDYWTRILLL